MSDPITDLILPAHTAVNLAVHSPRPHLILDGFSEQSMQRLDTQSNMLNVIISRIQPLEMNNPRVDDCPLTDNETSFNQRSRPLTPHRLTLSSDASGYILKETLQDTHQA